MAKNDKSDAKGKKDKTKGAKKGKKGKGAGDGVSVAGHPRAAAQVRRAKGFGGLACFAIAAYLSYKANVPPDQVALRALGFGVAGYMFAWAASVTVARHLVLAELRHAVESGRATYSAKPESPAAPTPAADDGAGKQDGDSE
jgi:hypothetical protein